MGSVLRVGSGAVIGVLVSVTACSSNDDDPLTTREIHREIESICASETDQRLEDGDNASPGVTKT